MTTLFFLKTLVSRKPKYSIVLVFLLPPPWNLSSGVFYNSVLPGPTSEKLFSLLEIHWASSRPSFCRVYTLAKSLKPQMWLHLSPMYCWLQPRFLSTPGRQTIQFKNGQRIWSDTFPNRTYRWPADMKRWSTSPIIERWKLKLQGNIISLLSEWFPSINQQPTSAGEDVEKRKI